VLLSAQWDELWASAEGSNMPGKGRALGKGERRPQNSIDHSPLKPRWPLTQTRVHKNW